MRQAYLFTAKPLAWNSTSRAHSFLPKQMTHAETREFLRVKQNPRYAPALPTTYCNVAAHDFATLRGFYLPRVWWTKEAIRQMDGDETVAAKYGDTVKELNANALCDWFEGWGEAFNWVKIHGTKVAQQVVNEGGMAIIVAARKDRSQAGHISVINPEEAVAKYVTQWQAGKVNSERLVSDWYTSSKYAKWGIWATS